MKKPARPSIQFPSYTNESSATAVDEKPWFAGGSAAADDDEETVVRAPRPAPAAPRPVTKTLPARTFTKPMPAAGKPAEKPAPAPARVAELGRRVHLTSSPIANVPPPPAEMMRPAAPPPPVPAPAPAWALPAFPVAVAPVPERKELPSFGPVAFDLDDGRSAPTVVVARPRRSLASWLAAAVAVVVGVVGGRELLDRSTTRDSSPDIDSARASQPMTAAAMAPATGGHHLTPEELFPRAQATTPPPAKISAAQYQREKARLAADLAQRNAPVFAPTLMSPSPSPSPRRASTPTLDDMIRAPRLRGEHD